MYLRERVAQAHPRWIPATVLLREIQARGYAGGISQLKAFLAPGSATGPPSSHLLRIKGSPTPTH